MKNDQEEVDRLWSEYNERQIKFLHLETDNPDGTMNWHEVPRKDIVKIELDLSKPITSRHPCTVYLNNGKTKQYMLHWLAITASDLFYSDVSPWAATLNKEWSQLLEERYGKRA